MEFLMTKERERERDIEEYVKKKKRQQQVRYNSYNNDIVCEASVMEVS